MTPIGLISDNSGRLAMGGCDQWHSAKLSINYRCIRSHDFKPTRRDIMLEKARPEHRLRKMGAMAVGNHLSTGLSACIVAGKSRIKKMFIIGYGCLRLSACGCIKPGVHTRDCACLRPDWTVASQSGRDRAAFIVPTTPLSLSRQDPDLASFLMQLPGVFFRRCVCTMVPSGV